MTNKIAALGIIALFLCTQNATPLALDWKKTAQKDFGEIERKLRKYHPGVLDPKSTHLRMWLTQGKKEFEQRLPKIDSEAGWHLALTAYVNGFHDKHLSFMSFRDPFLHLEWPQFILFFDGFNFLAKESLIPTLPNDSIVTKIDGVSIRKWITKYTLPFGITPGDLSSAFVEGALNACLWSPNPFIPKANSINILRQFEPENSEIVLNWQPISRPLFNKKIRPLISPQNPWKQQYDPITITDIAPHIAYVKIPTFMPAPGFATRMFKRSAKKLTGKRSHHAIIFDLQGNGGGFTALVDQFLQYLYGGARVTAAKKTRASQGGFMPTTKIYRDTNPLFHAPEKKEHFKKLQDKVRDSLDKSTRALVIQETQEIEPPLTFPAPAKPVTAKIFVIADKDTYSSSLHCIDILNEITNGGVTLIGQPPAPNFPTGNPMSIKISHRCSITIPMRLFRADSGSKTSTYPIDIPLSHHTMKDPKRFKNKLIEIATKKP